MQDAVHILPITGPAGNRKVHLVPGNRGERAKAGISHAIIETDELELEAARRIGGGSVGRRRLS